MQLSKRLRAVTGLITPGSRVADIGCDHAYTSIYLIEKHISPYVIAMDVNKGPIMRAKENVVKYGYGDKIDIRRADGLMMLKPGEVDTIMISGMGGILMNEILNNGVNVLEYIHELVLQPQSEIFQVRRNLTDLGFLITSEEMVKEDGKFYIAIKAEPAYNIKNQKEYELNKDEHLYYSRLLLNNNHPVMYEFLNKELLKLKVIYNKLVLWSTDKSIARQKEILYMIRLTKSGLEYYYNKEN